MKKTIATSFREMLKSWQKQFRESKDASIQEWLADKMEEMLGEEGREISQQVFDSVDLNLQKQRELKEANDNGQSSEEWLYEKILESVSDLPNDEKKRTLIEIYMAEVESLGIEPEDVDFEKADAKFLAEAIAKMGDATILNGMLSNGKEAEEFDKNIEEESAYSEFVEDIQEKNGKNILKYILAGVLTVLAKTGKLAFLSNKIPVRVWGNIACLSIDIVFTMIKVAKGELSFMKSMSRILKSAKVAFLGIILGEDGKVDVELVSGLKDIFVKAFKIIGNTIKGLISFIKSGEMIKSVLSYLEMYAQNIKGTIEETINWIVEKISTILGGKVKETKEVIYS